MKSRLSECIRMVREGHEVYVTHRGETVAEIRPPTHVADESIDREIRRRAQAGKMRLGARNRPEVYVETPARMPAETVRSLLHESRGEH